MKRLHARLVIPLLLFLSSCQGNGGSKPVFHQIGYFLGYSIATVLPLVLVAVILYWVLRLRKRSKDV